MNRKLAIFHVVLALALTGCRQRVGSDASPMASGSNPTATITVDQPPPPTRTPVPTEMPLATPGPEPYLAGNLQFPAIGAFSLTGHTKGISQILLTPEDQRAISISADGTLKVWDLETGDALLTLCAIQGHTCDFTFLDISPDGSRALARSNAEGGHEFRLLDLTSGAELASYPIPEYNEWTSVGLTLDGDQFITVSLTSGHIHIRNTGDGAEVRTLKPQVDGISAIAFSPDSEYMILAGWQGEIEGIEIPFWSYLMLAGSSGLGEVEGGELEIWNMRTGEKMATLQGHTAPVFAVEISADGSRAFSAALDGTVRAWDSTAGTELYKLELQVSPFSTGIVLTPGETRAILPVANPDLDEVELQVWELASGLPVSTLEHHDEAQLVGTWALPIDEERAIGVTPGSDLVIWDLSNGQILQRDDFGFAPEAIAITSDGRRAITGERFNTIEIRDLESLEVLSTLNSGHTETVTCMALMPDGRRLLTGSEDRTVRMWDIQNGMELDRFSIVGRAASIAITPDGAKAVLSLGSAIEILELPSGYSLLTLAGTSGELVITPDGERALVSSGSTVKILNLQTGRVERVIADLPHSIDLKMHLLEGGKVFMVVHEGGASVFNLETGERLAVFEREADLAVLEPLSAVSQDGTKWAVALYRDYAEIGWLSVIDLKSGEEVFRSYGHPEPFRSLSFTPDGTKLLSGSLNSVSLWDLEIGSELFAYPLGSAGLLKEILITPNGLRALVLSGQDLEYQAEFDLITVLDLSPWIKDPSADRE